MGGISFGISPVSLKFFLNGSCFTLFIRFYFMPDDGYPGSLAFSNRYF